MSPRALAALTLTAASACASSAGTSAPSPDAPAPAPASAEASTSTHEAGWAWHGYAAEAGSRRYRLFVPSSYDGTRPVPLVLMLHGCTQTAEDFAAGTRVEEHAERRGFLVAMPEQPPEAHPQRCWSWYEPAHQARAGGEPAMLAGIVREVMRTHAVDADRVHVAGISAGGAMAAILAATHPDLFASAAVHSGVAYGAAGGAAAALAAMQQGAAEPDALAATLRSAAGGSVLPALLVLHGAADPVVRPLNGEQLAAQWAEAAGLDEQDAPHAEPDGAPGTTTRRFGASDSPTTVELVLIDGVGHAWSGGSPDGTYTDPARPDATEMVVRFLLSHPRG